MYKKVKKFALASGLTVEEKAGIAYGNFNGYFIVIHQDPATPARHTIQLWVKPGSMTPVPAVVDFVNQCPDKFRYLNTASYSGTKIIAEFWGTGFKWGSEYTPCIESFLKELTSYCQSNQLIPCCESCGGDLGLSLYQIEAGEHVLCSSCYANTADRIHQRMNQEAQKGNGNIIGGIAGALLGSLIGVILWVLVYQLGYISALVGAVMVICSLKGYEMLGGRLNILGIVISCVVSALMLLFAEQACLAIDLYRALDGMVSIFGSFASVPSLLLSEPEILTPVVFELIMGYVLMAVGAAGTIHQTYKKNRATVDTRMVTPVAGSNPVR
ncbi:MAG: hypothetical protein NC429_04695 [Lachnospiraceae bacterium]|nr:hypothetical protein [Lachnospiraceae bacterium]